VKLQHCDAIEKYVYDIGGPDMLAFFTWS